MKLYLLYWDGWDYDQYSNAVVVAKSEEDARKVHPHGPDGWDAKSIYSTWCKKPEDVTTVTYVGEASSDLNEGDVVCASFHAG